MTDKNKSINLENLLRNIQDLDYISRVVTNEISSKNEILKNDTNNCKDCEKIIMKNNKNNKNNTNNNL